MLNLRRPVGKVVALLILLAGLTTARGRAQSICGLRSTASAIAADVHLLGKGFSAAPKAAVERENLKWELPVAAATGVLIGAVDRPAADRIQSQSLQDAAGRWSNIGLGMELGASAAAWGMGCAFHHPYAAGSGFKALEASGLALSVDMVLKTAFNRQYPYSPKSTGEFWEGGKSFPSGHTATSFAFASAIAHRYPHNKWIKWGSYALATGVSVSRYPAKKHFPSDILAGAPIGFLIGKYVVEHED